MNQCCNQCITAVHPAVYKQILFPIQIYGAVPTDIFRFHCLLIEIRANYSCHGIVYLFIRIELASISGNKYNISSLARVHGLHCFTNRI